MIDGIETPEETAQRLFEKLRRSSGTLGQKALESVQAPALAGPGPAPAAQAGPQQMVGPVAQSPAPPAKPDINYLLSKAARAQSHILTGGDDAYFAMFTDPQQDLDENLNLFERGFRGIAHGFASMAPASMTLLGGVIDYLGADEAGQDVAQAGMDLQQWLDEHVAVENPKLFDQVMDGFGSMASFAIPGFGVGVKIAQVAKAAKAGSAIAKHAKWFKAITGSTTMGFLEATVEQSQRQRELIAQGMSPQEALDGSKDVFWYNMGLLTLSNLPYFSPDRRVLRGLLSFFTEGGQERMQAVIQDVAAGRGRWSDFVDPHQNWTETLVGGIVGGVTGLALPGEGGAKETEKNKADLETEAGVDDYAAEPPAPATGTVSAGLPEPGTEPPLERTPAQKEAYWQEKNARLAQQEIARKQRAAARIEQIHALQDARGRAVPPAVEAEALAIADLEAALGLEYKTDIDLVARLTPEQFKDLAVKGRKAMAIKNPEKASLKALEVYDLAKSYLFRGAQPASPSAPVAPGSVPRGTIEAPGAPVPVDVPGPAPGAPAAPIVQETPAQGPVSGVESISAGAPEVAPVSEPVAAPAEVPVSAMPGPVTPAAQQAPKPVKAKPGKKANRIGRVPEGFEILPMVAIETEPETFQARIEGLSEQGINEEYVQNAVDNFDPQAVKPIEVWRDPKSGKWLVIDGHHTREILSRVGVKEAVVKIFTGTREGAIKASQERNDQRRTNDLLSQAQTVRGRRDAGTGKKEIETEAKGLYGRNAKTVIALSYLNPKGRILDAIRGMSAAAEDSDSLSNLRKMAKWIGEARRQDQKLTDAHEDEMFGALQQGLHKRWNSEDSFVDSVFRQTGVLGFDYAGALEITALDNRRPGQVEHDERLATAKREMDKATAKRDAAEKRMKGAPKELRDGAMARLNEEVAAAIAEWDAISNETGAVDAAARAEKEASLFSIGESAGTPRVRVRGRPDYIGLAESARSYGATSPRPAKARDVGDQMAESFARRMGVKHVEFVSGMRIKKSGKVIAGSYQPDTETMYLNVDSNVPLIFIATHEIGHRMQFEHPDLWYKLLDILNGHLNSGIYVAYKQQRMVLGYEESKIPGEFVADALADAARSDVFWETLSKENPTLFGVLARKVLDVIKSLRTMLSELGGQGVRPAMFPKEFAQIEETIGRIVAQMGTREIEKADKARAERGGDVGQMEMFSISGFGPRTPTPPKGATSLMTKMLERQAAGEADVRAQRNWRRGGIWRWMYQKMVDKNTYLYVAVRDVLKKAGIADYDWSKNPAKIFQLTSGWSKKVDLLLTDRVRSWDGKTIEYDNSLEGIIRDYGLARYIDDGQFGEFLKAATLLARKEAIENEGGDFFGNFDAMLNAGIESEYLAAEAEYNEYAALYDEYVKLHSTWEVAVAEITDWSNAMMKRLLQSGFLSQAAYDELVDKYKVYAPLYVLSEEAENFATHIGRSKAGAGKATWPMFRFRAGMTRMDPIDGLIKNAYRLEFLAHQNEAKLALADFVMDIAKHMGLTNANAVAGIGKRVPPKMNPIFKRKQDLLRASGLNQKQIDELVDEGSVDMDTAAKIWVVSAYQENSTVALSRNGSIEYWQLDPDLFEVYASTHSQGTSDLMKFFTAQTKMLRAGAVLTPEFMSRNIIRDFLNAGVIATSLVNNPIDAMYLPFRVLKGISSAYHKDQDWIDFVNDKAAHATLVSVDQEDLPKERDDLLRSADKNFRSRKARENPRQFILHSHPLTVLQNLSALSENSTRIAVYKKTRADLIKKGYSEKEARVRAAIEAREGSIDFNRSGEYGVVLNKMIPFFNAAIQGNDKMIRTMLRDKGGRSAAWTKATLTLTLPSVLLWSLNHDEDWYKEQPWYVKNMFWLFSVDGGNTIHKIPKPFDLGMIFGSLPERFLDWQYLKDPKAAKAWAENLANNFMPLDIANLLGPMAGTLNEIRSNYDVYRGTPIVKGYLQDVAPQMQYSSATSEFSKWMADTVPGGKLSPMMIDHFIRGSFGGLGQWGTDIASGVILASDDERRLKRPSGRMFYDTIPDWMPIIRGVTTAGPARYSRDLGDFYEEYDRSKMAVATLRAYKGGGASPDEFADLYRREAKYLSAHESLSRASEYLGRVSKKIRSIELLDPSAMSREERRAEIDELLKYRNLIVTRYMDRYRTTDWPAIEKQACARAGEIEYLYRQQKGR